MVIGRTGLRTGAADAPVFARRTTGKRKSPAWLTTQGIDYRQLDCAGQLLLVDSPSVGARSARHWGVERNRARHNRVTTAEGCGSADWAHFSVHRTGSSRVDRARGVNTETTT